MIKYFSYIGKLLKKIEDFLIRYRIQTRLNKSKVKSNPDSQQLEVYYEESFADELAFWGEDNVWREIELLLATKEGNVVDMCCGVGGTIRRLEKYKKLNICGFDISDFLIQSAIDAGIDQSKLKVANAISTGYEDNSFSYSYSIGSLEHFTEEDIDSFLKETKRITTQGSFHQIPTSRDEKFSGWLELDQSYYNMPESWWLEKFQKHFDDVQTIDSSWNDSISFGTWFICK